MKWFKKLLVDALEQACVYTHPVTHHKWWPFYHCPLALAAFKLDERWHVIEWQEVTDDDLEKLLGGEG